MTKSRDLGNLANGTFTGDFDATGSIKVSGTTVVNDSRELQNIATLDSTTATTISSAVGGGAAVQTFTSSGTWTKPSSGTVVLVTLIGGGGGGGRNDGTSYVNGAYGGYLKTKWIQLSDLPSSVTVTIGAGGAASTTTASAGSQGGDSSFGTFLVSLGGQGGDSRTSANGFVGDVYTGTNQSTINSNEYSYYVSGMESGVFTSTGVGNDSIDPPANNEGLGGMNTIYSTFTRYHGKRFNGHGNAGQHAFKSGPSYTRTGPIAPSGYGAAGATDMDATGASAGTAGFCSVIVL
jgi:hypothetical protein